MKYPFLLLISLTFISLLNAQIKFPKGDVYKHDSGQKIAIPNRSLAFVDALDAISFSIKKEDLAVIGEPNFNPDKRLSTGISLPPNENIIVSFTNNNIRNVKGKDLCVFNIGEMDKLELLLEVKKDTWKSIGIVTDKNPCLFLDEEIIRDTFFNRLKVLNKSQKPTIIDAIAALGTSGDRQLKKLTLDNFRFSTSNTYITLKFKDYRQWDGDRIKITVNGETVIPKTFLSIWWKKIRVVLNEGENSINITALNNGYIRPNTTEIRIYDGEKRYDTLLRLRKRSRKTIFIERA